MFIISLFDYYSKFFKDFMKIEIIDNKEFTEIWVEGELLKEVHRLLYRNHLKEILRTSEKKDLSALLLRLDVKIARGLVYKLLALKGYMKAELVAKLKRRKIDPRAIEEILQECEKLGYLNDQREGALFVHREKRKGWGPHRIALKLKSKAPELTELANSSSEEQLEMIETWIQKKLRGQNFEDLKVKQRLYRFLKNKGFEEELIRQSLFQD